MRIIIYLILYLCNFFLVYTVLAQSDSEANQIIVQILKVEQLQMDIVKNVMFDVVFIEGENKDGTFVEKVRIEKTIYIKYKTDTAFLVEEFSAFYKNSVKQSDEKLQSFAEDRKVKKHNLTNYDISSSMLKPFYPQTKNFYTIEYLGIANDTIEGYICHSFKVKANNEDDQLLNGSYYFDTESFQLVRVDFSPAKMAKKGTFKMKKLNLSIIYKEYKNNLWFPKKIKIVGEGKVMFFIGVKFAGTGYFSNPMINQDIEDKFNQ